MKKIFVILIVSVLSASLFGQLNYDRTNNTLTIGGSESKIVMQGTTGSVTLRSLPTAGGTVLIPSVVGFDTIATRQFVTALLNSFSAMVYPSAGIPVSTGTGWATSITDNSVNWNTAFSQTLQWDGSNINLNAEAGRSSLGGTTVGQAIFTLSNPSAIRFLRINANNSVSALTAADFKTALSLTSSDVSLGNVTNESKTTMFTSPVFTGTIPRYGSPVSDTLATRAYARSVAGYSGGGGGGTWGLITGNITEQADLSEVFGTKIDTGTVYTKAATNTLLDQKLSLSDTSAMLAPYPLTKSLPIDNWNTAYGWGDHSGAGYYTGTSTTIRQLLSSTATGLTYNNSTGVFSLTDGYTIPANTSITNWNAAHGWGNHASAGYYVGTDGTIRQLLSSSATGLTYNNSTGVFSLTDGYSIPANTSITNWNAAHGWGNHASAGYYVGTSTTIRQLLSSSATGLTYNNSTGVFSLTDGYSIPANTSITNWNAAHGWGNHASAGYYVGTSTTIRQLLSSSATGLTYTNSTGVFSLTSGYTIPLSMDITNWNTAYGWGDHSLANYINSTAATSIAEGVLDNAIDDAIIGVAVEDVVGGTTGRNRYMSPAQIENYVALHGGGGGLFSGLERVEFDVGDNFAPNDTETEFQHNVFTDKQVTLFRNKELSEFSYITGGIAVDPAFSTGEHVEIWLWPQGTWTTIGLGSTQDELLDGLGGFWRCEQNPASGITDEMGNHNLTTGSPAATLATGEGIYGNAVKIEHKELLRSSEYNQNIMPHGNAFAFSMWFNLDSLPSERGAPGVTPPPGRNAYLLNAVHSAATPSWNPQYAYIDRENETIYFRVQYVDGETSSYTDIKSNIAVEKEKWYHVVLNCPGAGEYLEIWLDGVNVSSAPNRRFQGVLAEATAALVIGRSNATANWSLVGMVDDIMMYPSRALSEKEIISLFAKGRGFDFDLE